MAPNEKPLVWLHGEVKSPPYGETLHLPWSRPMQIIGSRCHELRIVDSLATWRLIYRIDKDALVIVEVFRKQTQSTPRAVIAVCKKRLRVYDTY
jgi:phage-related protein